ncbi:MAG: hypothetical protein ACR2P1_22745 [Pseudomonadales bacterium]
MNSKQPFLLIVCLFCVNIAVADIDANRLLGYWQAEGKPAIVEITKPESDIYIGTVVQNAAVPKAVGKQVFKDLRYDAATQQWNGLFYIIPRDKDAKANVSSTGKDSFQMKVKVGFISRTVDWRRVDFPAAELETEAKE